MTAHIIEVRDLTRRFGPFVAVDRVTFHVEKGEIFGYLGANGAGKSTTIRMLCGLLAPSSGEAVVAGADILRQPEQVKFSIGYMSQKFSLYQDLTVTENLRFFAGMYRLRGPLRETRIDEALQLAGLVERRNDLTRALPGGTRQRLALASALLHKPAVLFLDEPTAGVDPASRRDFWRTIRHLAAAGTSLFVTTHHLDEAEYCRRVGLMVDGRLVALDTPEGLKKQHVPRTIYAVKGPMTAKQLQQALSGVPEIHSIRPFGASVHIQVNAGLSILSSFRELLAARGLQAEEVTTAEATLEDVFLELVEKSDASKQSD